VELQADAEHQQDDADLRELLCEVDVSGVARSVRADNDTGDEVANDRRKAKPLREIAANEGGAKPSGERENEPGFRHAIAMLVRGLRVLS
jgi:hypothetical protein